MGIFCYFKHPFYKFGNTEINYFHFFAIQGERNFPSLGIVKKQITIFIFQSARICKGVFSEVHKNIASLFSYFVPFLQIYIKTDVSVTSHCHGTHVDTCHKGIASIKMHTRWINREVVIWFSYC